MIFNMTGGGAAPAEPMSAIVVTAPAGSTVTCTLDDQVKTAREEEGRWIFRDCALGTWTAAASLDGQQAQATVVIQEQDQRMRYEVTLAYGLTPADFGLAAYGTLGTDYEVVYDDDTPIPQALWPTASRWKIRLLTSHTLACTRDGVIDVFCVGAGGTASQGGETGRGCGGGSGRTATGKQIPIQAQTAYAIVIGAGSRSTNMDGGSTSAFGITAQGGKHGEYDSGKGGDGGSGGASWGSTGKGGTDGGNGASSGGYSGGRGQGTTTREFAEPEGRLYASGGSNFLDGMTANSGDGGDAGSGSSGSSSGIVILRNAREVS